MKLKRNSPMSEVPREENGEIELNLGLSLCGSSGKPAKLNSSETPLFQKRVRDRRTTKEEEGEIGERTRKRERIEDGMDPVVLTLSRDASPLPATIPVVPQAYSCLPLHYPNAVPYSCVAPCWAPLSGPETSMIQPAGCRSFQPYQGNSGHNVVSDGSPANSCPAFSDNGSISQQGGSSSDTGSLSNHSKHEQSAHCETRENLGGVSSNHIKKDSSNSPNSKEKVTLPGGILKSNPSRQTKPQIQEDPAVTSQVPVSGPLRLASQDLGKPPKPDQVRMPDNQSQHMPKFSQMPCVSTTGNGPNGKTVTGFLYRYTKSEVSIICVCHGTSFSPAEFVEHAGGTDVSHPLKHITVIPSAF